MPNPITRRGFLVAGAVAATAIAGTNALIGAETQVGTNAAAGAGPASTQAARKLNIAIVGVGGRGADHVRETAEIANANIVALCDVDVNNLVQAARKIPGAAVFVDFRDMLEQQKNLEAVIVATPDHTHAVVTAAALHAGKHVYCEKPLAHTVREVRAITELAAQTKRVTQLGIQIHSLDNYRRVVELIQAGAIGTVSNVHIWNNRSIAAANPAEVAPPAALNYDRWLGPVPFRPFHPDFHPFGWRRRWSFGSGLLGDIGCHLMDVAFWALDLKYPTRIEATGEPLSDDACPQWIIATYDFATSSGAPVKLTWYDPPKTPPALSSWKLDAKFAGEGVVFVGDQGALYTNYDQHVLLPQEKFKTYQPPPKRIASSPGHKNIWIDACLKNDPTLTDAPFSYGGPLSEAALLGTVAFRAQKALEWDAVAMRFKNAPEAEKLLGYEFRAGWTL